MVDVSLLVTVAVAVQLGAPNDCVILTWSCCLDRPCKFAHEDWK